MLFPTHQHVKQRKRQSMLLFFRQGEQASPPALMVPREMHEARRNILRKLSLHFAKENSLVR
jgi:hypothetical protein